MAENLEEDFTFVNSVRLLRLRNAAKVYERMHRAIPAVNTRISKMKERSNKLTTELNRCILAAAEAKSVKRIRFLVEKSQNLGQKRSQLVDNLETTGSAFRDKVENQMQLINNINNDIPGDSDDFYKSRALQIIDPLPNVPYISLERTLVVSP